MLKLVGFALAITPLGTVAAAVLLLFSPMLLTLKRGPITAPPIVPPPLLKLGSGAGPVKLTVPLTLVPATT